jgi:hypothetical protein
MADLSVYSRILSQLYAHTAEFSGRHLFKYESLPRAPGSPACARKRFRAGVRGPQAPEKKLVLPTEGANRKIRASINSEQL